MEDEDLDGQGIPVPNAHGGEEITPLGPHSEKVSLAMSQERIRALEEIVEQLREQVEVERERYTDPLPTEYG